MTTFDNDRVYEINGHRSRYLAFAKRNHFIEGSYDAHHFVYRTEDQTIVQVAIDTRCFDEEGRLIMPIASWNHGRVSIPKPKEDGKDQKQFAERWHKIDEFLSEVGLV